MSDKSPIDDLFYSIYGYYPKKQGRAFELLTTAALKIINPEAKIYFDQRVEGLYSGDDYQIDGVMEQTAIEAKDHTLGNEKVERAEVQKLGGGLPDLPFKNGIFSSATGYTCGAERYSKGTIKNPATKNISLYIIRLSTREDESGRTIKFIFEVIVTILDDKNGKFTPSFTRKGYEAMGKKYPEGSHQLKLDCIYNEDGTIFTTVNEWLNKLLAEIPFDDKENKISGKYQLQGKSIMIKGDMIEITHIDYEIPIKRPTHIFEIDLDGKACLYIKDDTGNVDEIITDIQLKNVVFDENSKEVLLNRNDRRLNHS